MKVLAQKNSTEQKITQIEQIGENNTNSTNNTNNICVICGIFFEFVLFFVNLCYFSWNLYYFVGLCYFLSCVLFLVFYTKNIKNKTSAIK